MKLFDLDFLILFDNVIIVRSRKYVIKYYDILEVGDFFKCLELIFFYMNIVKSEDLIDYKIIYEELMNFSMGVYVLIFYI